MELWLIFAIIIISIVSVMIYAALAVFFPEWVGIMGKAALKAEESHRDGSKADDWFDSSK